METAKKRWSLKHWIGGAVVLVAVAAVFSPLIAVNVQKEYAEGERFQNRLILSYNDYKTGLRICLDEHRVVAGVILPGDVETKDLLVGVIGQFKPDPDDVVTQPMMVDQIEKSFSRLDQTAPDQIRLYQLGDAAVDCRGRFLDWQLDNQAQAQALHDWVHPRIPFLTSGLPSDALVVVGPDGRKLYADAALRFILEPKLL